LIFGNFGLYFLQEKNMNSVKITIVADTAARDTFAGEFGLSLLLENEIGLTLFDTGAGTALRENLEKLEPGFAGIGRIVLSHGHYDHTGALAWRRPRIPVA